HLGPTAGPAGQRQGEGIVRRRGKADAQAIMTASKQADIIGLDLRADGPAGDVRRAVELRAEAGLEPVHLEAIELERGFAALLAEPVERVAAVAELRPRVERQAVAE